MILHHRRRRRMFHPTSEALPFLPILFGDVEAAAEAVGVSFTDGGRNGSFQKPPDSIHQPFEVDLGRVKTGNKAEQLHRVAAGCRAGRAVQDLDLGGGRRKGLRAADWGAERGSKGVAGGPGGPQNHR